MIYYLTVQLVEAAQRRMCLSSNIHVLLTAQLSSAVGIPLKHVSDMYGVHWLAVALHGCWVPVSSMAQHFEL